MSGRRSIIAALVVGGVVLAVPAPSLSAAGQAALATTAVVGALWVTGGLPLPVTALLVPPLLVVSGAVPRLSDGLVGFADPVLFLMLGGFVLARSLQVHALDRRFALHLLARIGGGPKSLVLAMMVAAAVLSMFVSNTATAAMLAPVAIGIADQVVDREETEPVSNFEVVMLLGVAYAASIGGVGSLVGTPPNAIVVGQLDQLVGIRVTFVEWLAIGIPTVAVTLPIAWFLLVTVVYPPTADISGAQIHARRNLADLPALDYRARRTIVVFGTTVGLWLLGGLGFLLEGVLPDAGFAFLYGGGGRDGALYFATVALLAIPALVVADAADWEDLVDVDWGTLVLIGGGISLANGLSMTDALTWLADTVLAPLAAAPLLGLVLVIVLASILAGELASNTAMTAILAPLLVGFGTLVGDATFGGFLAIVAAVAASFGFALPVATPPNAIAYGTGRVTRGHMLRAGGVLDVLLGLCVVGVLYTLFQVGVFTVIL